MVAAPKNPLPTLWQKPAKFVVLLGPEDGSKPRMEYPEDEDGNQVPGDEVEWLIPVRCCVSAGGSRQDTLLFNVDLDQASKRLVDTTTPTEAKRQIELRMLDDKGEASICLGWGFLSANPQAIRSDAEATSYEARISNHHFGVPLTSYPVWHAETSERLDVERPLVFNPQIDEIIEGNMSSKRAPFFSNPPPNDMLWHYMIDPESVRTAAARTLQTQTASLWTLTDAVLAICWWLNPDETHIKNPTPAKLEDVFTDRDAMLKNVALPYGIYLPEALDRLLAPFEYGWYLRHWLNDNQRGTDLQFFPRGSGVKKKLLLQRPGENRDIKKTTVADLEVQYSINDLANRIEVYGDFLKRESTFILQKGWDDEYDETTLEDLSKGSAFAELHPAVGRKWILNEAGDYTGLRTEIDEPYDVSPLFDDEQQAHVRRKFLRCLTQHPDADDLESNGYRVDWYDEEQPDALDHQEDDDPGWVRVKWPFSVLEKECGIWFEGVTPPPELWSLIEAGTPEKARIRITATIVGDQRVSGIATRRTKSPNGQDVTLVLDLKDRFQYSEVAASSIYAGRPSVARDDSDEIQDYAEDIREISDAMKMHCSVTLEGVKHPDYAIGDLIDNVKGRNLSLNGYDPSAGTSTRNPQVVGFTYHLQGGQRLELMLDSFQKERPQVVTGTVKGGAENGRPV